MLGTVERVWLRIPRPIAVIILFASCGLALRLIGFATVYHIIAQCIVLGALTMGYVFLEDIRRKRLGGPSRVEIAIGLATMVLCVAAGVVVSGLR